MHTEQLSTPVTKITEFGQQLALTHRAWGFTFQPWADAPLVSYAVLGVIHPETGTFKSFPGTEEYAHIRGADLEQLLAATPSGKPAGAFRTDDVRAKHLEIVARIAAERAAQEAAILAQQNGLGEAGALELGTGGA